MNTVLWIFRLAVMLAASIVPIVAVAAGNTPPILVTGTAGFSKTVVSAAMPLTHVALAADFDLDGDLDIVATSEQNNSVVWFENDGNFGFIPHDIDRKLGSAYPASFADLDLDGDMDVLAGGYRADQYVWYENLGAGTFTKHVIATQDGAHSIFAVDMDGDGDLDLGTAGQDSNTIAWYENDGSQSFTVHVIDTAALAAKSAVPLDFDGDGDIDIIVASFGDNTVAWYENDGFHNFTKRVVDGNARGAYFATAADLDGDGGLDIVAASQLDNTVAWYRNDGGTFTKKVLRFAAAPRFVATADVDGDGDIDILSASVDDSTIALYVNDGAGNFATVIADGAAIGAYSAIPVDMNGDGLVDILGASKTDGTVSILFQKKVHNLLLAVGEVLTIDSSVLLAIDQEESPEELVYTLSHAPTMGVLRLAGAPLSVGGSFTQLDVEFGRISYDPTAAVDGRDSFALELTDGIAPPSRVTFTVTIGNRDIGSSGIVSDDFNARLLDGIWTFQDPVGDGSYELVGAGTSDARLRLSVPAGTNHDVWTGGNRSVRVMQPALDDDFEIEVKFESLPTQRFQLQGLLIEQDAQNFLRVDFYSDGSVLRLFAARFVNGVPTTLRNQTLTAAPTLYLRLTRQGDTWTPQVSYDGASWIGVSGFTHALAVTSVGVFAGNAGGNPAFTAVVDYFFNTAAPIVPEDGLACLPDESFSLTTTVFGPGSVQRTPDQATYGCGEVVTLTAQPQPGAEFTGWGGALSGTTTPVGLTLEADTTVTADFAADTTPPVISNVQVTAGQTAATVSWTTDEPSTGMVAYGETPAYELGSADSPLGTSHSVSLTALAAGTGHHYQIQATDAAGNTASTADLTFTTLVAGNVAPTASFSVTPQSGAAPLTVDLDASASSDSDGTLIDYAWDFGDGALVSGVTASHTYAAAGSYPVQLTVTDDAGGVDTATATVTVLSSGSSGIVSDDFNAPLLDGIWTFQDPVGDGSYELVGAGTSDARLRLSVPAGTNHDVWTGGNRSVRVMQPALDDDFEIEVKFESQPTQRFQLQGLLIEQDPQNFLRVDFYSDGSVLRLFAARFVNGVPTTLRSQTITAAPTLYLRLTRQGDTWTPQVSYDGASWIGVSGFTHALAVTSVGVFAGNAGGNPAFTAVVDYFFNTAAPIVPEDGLACLPDETFSLTTTVFGPGSVQRTPEQATYGCGETVTLTAQPQPGAEFTGWGGALSGTTTPVGLTVEADTTVTADFAADTTPPVISNVQVTAGQTAATVSWTTDEPSTGMVAYGETPAYELGSADSPLGTSHSVNLTALAAGTGHHYQIQATDAAGNAASTADLTFTTLVAGNVAPTASFSVTPQSGAAPLTVDLDASASSDSDGALIDYAWDFGDGALVSGVTASHTYAAAGSYTVQLTVTDDAGGVGTATATVTVLSSGSSGIVSDDFNAPLLDGIWTFQDPVGDGSYELVGAGTSDARLRLSVPAGTNHDVWTGGNRSVRVMQPALDDDFEIEVKFESLPTQRFQLQGLLIEQDPQNFLRVDFYSDGSVLRLFAARFVNGVPTTLRSQTITAAPTLYLRLTRQGDTWTPQYSYDGVSWIGVSGFTHALAVTSVGVFAGNAGGNPAFTAVVDYFFNTAAPIVPEDGLACLPGELFSLTTTVFGPGSVQRTPDQATYGCGETVTLTAQPQPGAEFTGWGGALSGTTTPVGLTLEADTTVTADFAADTTPPVISNVQVTAGQTAATVSWTTDEPSTGVVAYGETPAYELGSADSPLGTSHSVSLTALAAGTGHHYQIQATDAAGNTASTADLSFTTSGGQGGNSPPVIDVWYGPYQPFGYLGVPQRWINVLGNVSDPDGISSLSYSLNGGPARPLSIGPDDRRLAEAGDFVIEIDYMELAPEPGLNDVVIAATDSLGSTSLETVTVDFGNSGPWPQPYTIDWDTQASVQDAIQVVDGNWVVTSQGVRTLQIDYDRLLAVGDLDWQSYEITVPITIHGSEPSGPLSGAPGVGIILRWTGHTDSPVVCAQPHCGWLPSGPIGWWRSGRFTLDDEWDPSVSLQVGVTYVWKMRVQSTQANGQVYHSYSLKVWQDGETEPTQWNLTKTYAGGLVTSGSALLIAHHMDVTFGDLTVIHLDTAQAPLIGNIEVEPGETSATISWTTNEPATGRVDYGFTSSYELGSISGVALTTSHNFSLTGLQAGALYHYRVSSVNESGVPAISESLAFRTNGRSDASGIVSDDFNEPMLSPTWEFQNPVGDGSFDLVGSGSGAAQLLLNVPGGTNHDVWTSGNRSVRIMQASEDVNIEVEVKFESQPNQPYQIQGLLVEQDDKNFLRVDYYSDSDGLRAFAAGFVAGVPKALMSKPIASTASLFLRLARQGDIWTPMYSADGTTWSVLGSFTHVMAVSTVGVFAGNAGLNPAFTAVVDYFFNTASPVIQEDGTAE
jgi:PKD repeat protein